MIPLTQFLKNKQQTPSLILGVVGLSSFVEKFVKKHIEKPKIVYEPKVLVSSLRKWREECRPQPNPELTKQRQKDDHIETKFDHLVIWFNKKDVVLIYAKTKSYMSCGVKTSLVLVMVVTL